MTTLLYRKRSAERDSGKWTSALLVGGLQCVYVCVCVGGGGGGLECKFALVRGDQEQLQQELQKTCRVAYN